MFKTRFFAAAVACMALTGCMSFTPAGPISPPSQIVEQSLPGSAMIKDVQVTDQRLDEKTRRNIGNQLTTQLSQHVEKGEYFRRVISFPAKLEEQDVQLQFDFSSLQGKRTPHPGYFPGALLTLTIWIWVNGPIYVDKYDLAAELRILDREGKQLAQSQKKLVIDKNTGLWDYDYMFPSGGQQLTELVEQLLHDGTAQLSN